MEVSNGIRSPSQSVGCISHSIPMLVLTPRLKPKLDSLDAINFYLSLFQPICVDDLMFKSCKISILAAYSIFELLTPERPNFDTSTHGLPTGLRSLLRSLLKRRLWRKHLWRIAASSVAQQIYSHKTWDL